MQALGCSDERQLNDGNVMGHFECNLGTLQLPILFSLARIPSDGGV